ncbi:MAG TPA: ABC transporter substrate-binding protein [Amycolatopsis sp.]|uniref:ABC transporter substrate-binding protein n=1 Tax=Amycolatopsis sp. TaxID=37632 RepID=UPI002B465BA9|nr:ABC transporter substrate-binding protein [Amycolatopsis sp.]HKS44859.1 ABC transporter substrate-binding protein [Amycolatopsis sp.]
MRKGRLYAGLLVPTLAVSLAACGNSGESTSPASTTLAPPTNTVNLAGICPATVVVQMDWEPEAEHAGAYELVGAGYTIDSDKKRVSGPLVIDGMNTGVKIEVRAGGSAIGFQNVSSQMYVDKEITLGAITTDSAISASTTQPVTAVVSPLNRSPQMLMWDPATHHDWNTIGDIGRTDAKVVVSTGSPYPSMLVEKGLVKQSQIDTSYDGAPARFVANPGIAQQGFATAEPYIYQHEVQAWQKPVKYQLLVDVGYDVYPEALSVRTADLTTLSPCLKKLVPILQKAQANYIADPAAANKLIVETVRKYNDSWTYSADVADFAVKAMKDLKIVANDTTGPIGGMDPARVQSAIDTFAPILTSTGAKVKDGLKAADIATGEFIDKTVRTQ